MGIFNCQMTITSGGADVNFYIRSWFVYLEQNRLFYNVEMNKQLCIQRTIYSGEFSVISLKYKILSFIYVTKIFVFIRKFLKLN